MPKSKDVTVETNVKDKIKYLGLNFERVPKTLIATDKISFRPLKGNDERQYKQYKFIKISDIDILLTPTHRMDSLKERMEEASPLYMYLDSKNDENASKYMTFLSMLKKVDIAEVEAVESEQRLLSKKIPYKVKFNGNYLWQIYYSEESKKYFMLVPTEDSDYSTFFYLIKKKLEYKENEMIYVPISYLDYSGKILKKSEIKDLENYLWLFTKDYPAIYEVHNKENKESLQIIGETPVYGKIKTLYKMKFESSKEATKYFKLLKALFILQMELPLYFNFVTKVDDKGLLEIYLDDEKIEYDNLLEFVSSQYKNATKLKYATDEEIDRLKQKLSKLKQESTKLEQEYLEKEKIISTYLECKKSFFGKVKYYFKFGKKAKKANKKEDKKTETIEETESREVSTKKKKVEKRNFTLDELIVTYKELEIIENSKKNIIQDINAIKLKNKNLKKKIENATSYINEINEHKKSIFEFWKYSNKDEVATLEEGEEEELNISHVEKTFDFDSDFEKFGENIDKSQRMRFTDSELDSSYIAATRLLDTMNDIYIKKTLELKDYAEILEKLKAEKNEYLEENGEDFDIFGNFSRDDNKEKNLGSKTHREAHRDAFEILGINEDTKAADLKKALVETVKNIKKALKKNNLEEEIYVYKALGKDTGIDGLQLFSLNEETEIKKYIQENEENNNITLYRLKLPKGINYIALSNIVFYNNKNMTLPVGMNQSDRILIDISNIKPKEEEEKEIKIKYLENEKYDFSEPVLKTIEITEMEI